MTALLLPLSFVVTGACRTKKNSRVHATYRGRVIPLPSKAWTKWASEALIEQPGLSAGLVVRFKPSETIRVPVNCRALFYRDANRGDACGYYQGLADLLEKRGVVENDRLIVSWNGSRLLVDRENPRTEVTLEAES